MIEIDRLTKRFGDRVAIGALSLKVAPGQLYALLGPNGAGKSTTIACLLGFERPDAGRALVNGIDVAAQPDEARRHLAYIPEQVALYESFTGVENVAYFSRLSGHDRSEDDIAALLTSAGLQAEAHRRPTRNYSKGMRQKVGIAIALAKDASALLLDEPTSGLDPAASHEFSVSLGRLRARGTAILMATHDLHRTMQDADTIGILVAGRLVEERNAKTLGHRELEDLYMQHVL